ncbi:signal peptidase II [Streptosporangium becharense]|uniref:Lipoprotein signal peptidase n=1 Tax=Streptosporangium becharense TaxID=1816182 RepID=A0A7W9IDJ7_9ACTN|nr:signal peptidase II [Streptosporangium becharense]MBB2912874.1 signal peptidase II [Streptosporangium becharense]MBB5818301.1 signal peptidase II [Streptosporangium becharense]
MRDLQAAGGAPLTGDAADGAAPAAPPLARRRVATLMTVFPIVYVLDLVTKTIVLRTLEGREPLVIIPDLLQFRVIFNSGAAFGLGTGLTIVFTCVATGVVVAILRTARNLRSLPWAVTLGLLLGGALGNLTDRVFRWPSGFGPGRPSPFQGHVVDFIETFPGHFPIWNVADSAVVCGGILAVLLAWRGYQIDGTRDMEQGGQDGEEKNDG